jgi:hypothetical protein
MQVEKARHRPVELNATRSGIHRMVGLFLFPVRDGTKTVIDFVGKMHLGPDPRRRS